MKPSSSAWQYTIARATRRRMGSWRPPKRIVARLGRTRATG
jgi:hypothetical protein